MHLIRSGDHGLGHLQVSWMVSNLSFSYSGLFTILPVLAFLFCDLGSVLGALAGQDRGREVIEYFSLLHILGNQDPFCREPTLFLVFLLLMMYNFSCFL